MMKLDQLATKLLYVEDDDDFREIIGATFVNAGFDVTMLSSAEGALEQLALEHFDVIVTDYNMGGETGAWLLSNAASKGYLKATAAIVLTSEARPKGVDGYTVLRKPIAIGSLLAAIADAIGALLPAPIVSVGAPAPAELELVLYVTSSSQESHTAIRNLRRALAPYDQNRFHLTIFDVSKAGDDVWYESLEEDRVIVTPTLVKRKPAPKNWIVGTLSPGASVQAMLASVLGPPGR